MPTLGPMIADSARLALGYAERLLQGIPADRFARCARVGDTVIQSNHPAFIYGHLSLYAPRILSELGADASAFQLPEKYSALFSKDAACVDDVDGTLYPPMEEVTGKMFAGHRAVIDALQTADDDLLTAANPNEAMRAKFATKGSMHNFYVGGHFMMHMGQLSAWRRAAGLGPA